MDKTIGRYQIQGELGRGGFGTVYRAWDPTVHRSVAIKLLTVQGDEDMLTRFRNEAAAAGNLHHRNIVTIHDFGEHNGTPYMVMQLLEGQTLQEVMVSRRPLTLVQKMNIMGQVADGLNHAHLHGVVHRDVKPPNIMILPDESVQIMDFGIARLTASKARQTRTGFVIGTVLYMAPEQFLPNKIVDHRADIWSYGVIYYELLAGQHPFAAAEETAVLYQIAHVDPPPLTSLCPEIPVALEEVINRLLAREPDLRYSSLRDVQFDVQPILVELKREQAAQMVESVRQLTAEERFEEAQAAAQRILELDPSNREAHSLLVSVKQRLQRRLIQPKIDGLLQRAEQEVQARSFQAAIDALEAALRLSNADPAIQGRLAQVKTLQEKARRAERLLIDAQRELRAQNYTAAFRIASEAAKTDPGNSSASHLISQIQHEVDFREAQRRLQDGLAKARGQLLLQQFDEAIQVLNALAADFPDDQNVIDMLTTARREKAQREREERRRRDVSAIRDVLRDGRFEDAISRLELLLAGFPGDVEINQLLTFARDEADAHRRTQVLARTRTEVDRLVDAADFDGAIRVLEDALIDYPGDGALVRLMQSVAVARSDHEARQRTEAITAILQHASELERKGDSRAALEAVECALEQFPGAEALLSVCGRLRQQVVQQDRRDTVARQCAEIEQAIRDAAFSRALTLIDTARREFPGERAFDALQARALSAKNAADLAVARTRIRSEMDASRFDLALDLVSTALKRFPGQPQLLALEREIRDTRAALDAAARSEREERERKAREEAERLAAEERARQEAEQRAREESERKVREEAERQARVEAERRAREDAERKAREEAARLAQIEAERKAAEHRARAEFERAAAEQRAREDAARRAAEQQARREAEERDRRERERTTAAAASATAIFTPAAAAPAPAPIPPVRDQGLVPTLPRAWRTEEAAPERRKLHLYAGGAAAALFVMLVAGYLADRFSSSGEQTYRPPVSGAVKPGPAPTAGRRVETAGRTTSLPPPQQPTAPGRQAPADKPLAERPVTATKVRPTQEQVSVPGQKPAGVPSARREVPQAEPQPSAETPVTQVPPGVGTPQAGTRVTDPGARVGTRPVPDTSAAEQTPAAGGRITDPGSRPEWNVIRTGKVRFSGELVPGAQVTISPAGGLSGAAGEISVDRVSSWAEVEITRVSSGQVDCRVTGPQTLVLKNTGTSPVRYVEVSWRLKR